MRITLNRPVEKQPRTIFNNPLSITAHTVIKYTSSTEISANFKSISISITADFVCPTVPYYEESGQTIITTSDKFEEWFKKDAFSHSKWPIPETLSVHTTFYLCDHAGADKKAKNSTGTIGTTNVLSSVDNDQVSSSNQLEVMRPKKIRITMKSSIKIGCTAKIIKHVMTDGTIHIEYHWKHPDHCPWDIKEITNLRLPFEIKQWITEKVSENMDWKTIKKFLRTDDECLIELEKKESFSSFPMSLLINYQDVKNIINAHMNKLSRKSCHDKHSCEKWIKYLEEEKNCSTLFRTHENGPFLISWVSDWQKKFLEEAEECCIDSTHKTCKSITDSSNDSYLFTIVVHNYTTNRGLPVCFFITNMKTIPTLHQWLTWIKTNFSLNVKRVMIDCSSAETAAIRDAFEGSVQILLCHWHIKRAWETHVKRGISFKRGFNVDIKHLVIFR
ncbi:hypothetical protein RMATCC62417_16475 [Rhizopus microsporus]|nr:hypothetical protein RMATCC62417_16475 [Rhizopus microsporus]